ncbi:hypothetical protein [Streptomyces sp. NPDC059761]|uniref:hypothetical protein n=1 Tax=Streptomyces sp. NPDC059761 TaxID=3346937 RepID=UPI003660FEEF
MTLDGTTAFLAMVVIFCVYGLLSKWIDRRQYKIAAQAEHDGPRPIDPQNPPTYVHVVRADDDPETYCTCHDRLLSDGETVLYWPKPTEILCSETTVKQNLLGRSA